MSWSRTPGDIVAEIKMLRTIHPRVSCALLEGASDVRFWRSRVVPGAVELIDAQGKTNVIGAMLLASSMVTGVVGVVDDDLDSVLQSRVEAGDLIYTDWHDLEVMLADSGAFERLIAELGDPVRIASFRQSAGVSPRDAAYAISYKFGLLRWFSLRSGKNLAFERLPIGRFVDEAACRLDEAALLEAAARLAGMGEGELRKGLAALPTRGWDPRNIVHGHDLMDVVAIGLRSAWGNRKASREAVEMCLRASFHRDDLVATRMYGSIKAWENRTNFRIC